MQKNQHITSPLYVVHLHLNHCRGRWKFGSICRGRRAAAGVSARRRECIPPAGSRGNTTCSCRGEVTETEGGNKEEERVFSITEKQVGYTLSEVKVWLLHPSPGGYRPTPDTPCRSVAGISWLHGSNGGPARCPDHDGPGRASHPERHAQGQGHRCLHQRRWLPGENRCRVEDM